MPFPALALTLGFALSSPVWFDDVTERAGIPPLPYGEAVAIVDFDADGLPDLFLPNVRHRHRLLKNGGGGRFEDVSDRLNLAGEGGVAAAAGDFDGDARPDLYLVRGADPFEAPNLVYLRGAEGGFADVSAASGASGRVNGISAVAADFTGDGRDDVFVAGWGGLALYESRGVPPVFADVTRAFGLERPDRAWVATASDFDGDGRLDLFVTRGSYDQARGARLFLARAGGFEEVSEASGLSQAPWSLGAVAQDFDGDGDFDLYVGSYAGKGRLYRNDGGARFADVTAASGLTAEKSVGVAAGMIDADLLPDLVVAGFPGPARLFRNLGGLRFEEVSPPVSGLGDAAKNEGLALGDVDGDGAPDLYVTNYAGKNRLYRNATGGGAFLKVRLAPAPTSRLGAVARLYEPGGLGNARSLLATQELSPATGMGQGPGEFLFRLGERERVDLSVTLPGGQRIERRGLPPGVVELP